MKAEMARLCALPFQLPVFPFLALKVIAAPLPDIFAPTNA